jgi:hypothetical protein
VFQEISTNISINAGGSVAFRSLTAAAGRGIFVVAPSGAITTIADDSDGLSGIEEGPSINDDGAVVFLASPSVGVQAVIMGSGGALATIADTNGARAFRLASRSTATAASPSMRFSTTTAGASSPGRIPLPTR